MMSAHGRRPAWNKRRSRFELELGVDGDSELLELLVQDSCGMGKLVRALDPRSLLAAAS